MGNVVGTSIYLLAVMASLGAFDTIYFHEWKARLAHLPEAQPELSLHAARDFIYGILFASLPYLAWHGLFAIGLAGLFLAEIAITLADFVIEDRVRKVLGGVYPGERITHALMGLVYGAATATAVPVIWQWWLMPTGILVEPAPIPVALRGAMVLMAVGVSASGTRDLHAAIELHHPAQGGCEAARGEGSGLPRTEAGGGRAAATASASAAADGSPRGTR
jgi:hypothetical protein